MLQIQPAGRYDATIDALMSNTLSSRPLTTRLHLNWEERTAVRMALLTTLAGLAVLVIGAAVLGLVLAGQPEGVPGAFSFVSA